MLRNRRKLVLKVCVYSMAQNLLHYIALLSSLSLDGRYVKTPDETGNMVVIFVKWCKVDKYYYCLVFVISNTEVRVV